MMADTDLDPNPFATADDGQTAEASPPEADGAVSPGRAGSGGWVVDWGRLLRIARQVAGFSLNELARQTGLSKGYLSKLESGALGAANPSRATLAALARALPSFRPLALTLAPGMGAEELAFEGVAPAAPADLPPDTPPDLAHTRLGWKELEVLAALTVLESSALPHPLTATLIARALDRGVAAVRGALASLCRSGLVAEIPQRASGQRAEYRVIEGALRQVGAARVGDLLLLATALIGAGSRDAGTGERRAGHGATVGRPEQ
jgi:hypothetical protein